MLVQELMSAAQKSQIFPGLYMPELIRRGFDKIHWNKDFHNDVKIN